MGSISTHTSEGSARHLPDFIIGGAMKSATSTLHYILEQHNEIYISGGEIHFFSIDDFEEHPAFFFKYDSQWTFQDYNRYFDVYLSWYKNFFKGASSGQKIGDHSTIYLPSSKAPERIADLLPNVELIFLLRDPVDRAYSQYWHRLRKGRATRSFENTIQYGDDTIITRGFYREQLERYYDLFPREQITTLIFADFISDMQFVVDEICKHLGLSESVDLSDIDTTKKNTARVPRWPQLLMWQNDLLRSRNARQYQDHLPDMPKDPPPTIVGRVLDSINFRLREFNLADCDPPPMKPATRSFLQQLYAKENRGLSDLIGTELQQYWPYMGK